MKQETLDSATGLHRLLTSKGMSVAAAESCTGGLVSHLLTLLPGSSAFFVAGLVTYSNQAKESILGIDPGLLREQGAVSEAVARAMAEAARRLSGADIAIASTGNLGPDVLEGKERGLVYVAVNSAHGTETRTLRLAGGRDENREEAALQAVLLLAEAIEKS